MTFLLCVLVAVAGLLGYAFISNAKIAMVFFGLWVAGAAVTLDRVNETVQVGHRGK